MAPVASSSIKGAYTRQLWSLSVLYIIFMYIYVYFSLWGCAPKPRFIAQMPLGLFYNDCVHNKLGYKWNQNGNAHSEQKRAPA